MFFFCCIYHMLRFFSTALPFPTAHAAQISSQRSSQEFAFLISTSFSSSVFELKQRKAQL